MNIYKFEPLKAKKPQNAEQFGFFLAGLIDADGHINKVGTVSLYFHQSDVRVALYIKKVIGYGTVSKTKNSRSYRYQCCLTEKVRMIGGLIRNKLRHPNKIEQFNTRLVPKIGGQKTTKCTSYLLDNHWLAGFIQGDGSFQIQINPRKKADGSFTGKVQIMVVIQITQKNPELLRPIKQDIGGGVLYHDKRQDCFYYNSSSITNAAKFVNYLDQYQVIGLRFKIYQLWRQSHI